MNTSPSSINIVIIEDEVIIAQDIAGKIRKLGYGVLKILHNSEKAIDFLSFHTPDLVLCDIRIKGPKDGIEVAEIVNQNKKIPFIFLTSLSDRVTLDRAKKTLPYGYIVKPFNERDLLSGIEMALYKHMNEKEALKITKEKIDAICLKPLTKKEYEFLLDVTKGLSNSQLADKHFVSINTVKYHMRNIVSKLQVSNRADAMHKILNILTGQ